MMWIYYTGMTPESEQDFLYDNRDATRLVHNHETGRIEYAEYTNPQVGNEAWIRMNSRYVRPRRLPEQA